MKQLSPERRQAYLTHLGPLAHDYEPSRAVWRQMQGVAATVISAPSGAGKDTVIKAVVERTGIHNVPSKTTRQQRIGEVLGQGYSHFFNIHNPEERWHLLRSLTGGAFVQVEPHQTTHDLYGSCPDDYKSVSILNATARTYGRLVRQGLFRSLRQIYIVTPTVERLISQLDGRGPMDPGERAQRLHEATPSLTTGLNNKDTIFIINDTVSEAASQVTDIIQGRPLPRSTLAAGRLAATALLRGITSHTFSYKQQPQLAYAA